MYTSGRTVKSKVKRVSPTAKATAEARRLVTRCLPGVSGVTIDSQVTADPITLAIQTRTCITFPETVDASDLACAVETMPGIVRSTWSTVSIAIIREA